MKSIKWIEKIRKATSTRGFVCDCCKTELFDYPKTRVCGVCESKFFRNRFPVCSVCGRHTVTDGVCLSCKEHPPAFTGVSPFVYVGETASIINRLKNGDRRLCYYCAEQILRALETLPKRLENVVMLPVPMTEEKKRRRGYNQAEDLADALYDLLLQSGVTAELYTDVLIKVKETPAQKYLTSRERRKNLQGAFRIVRSNRIKGKTVLLVDDIMTTGATGDVCARLCRRAGVKEVYFASVASLPERAP